MSVPLLQSCIVASLVLEWTGSSARLSWKVPPPRTIYIFWKLRSATSSFEMRHWHLLKSYSVKSSFMLCHEKHCHHYLAWNKMLCSVRLTFIVIQPFAEWYNKKNGLFISKIKQKTWKFKKIAGYIAIMFTVHATEMPCRNCQYKYSNSKNSVSWLLNC